MRKFIATGLICSTLMLSSCAEWRQNDPFTKENIGTLAGAAGGAWVGSNIGKGSGNIAAIAAGTLLGAALGKSVGASLDQADMAKYHQTSQNALETARSNTTSTWRNPDSGNSGSFTPRNVYQNNTGEYCREYNQTIVVAGRREEGYGEACRQPDGRWKIIR